MTTPERKSYMEAYRAANPQKWKRSPEAQAKINDRRRAKYAADQEHRDAIKAQVRAWTAANPDKVKHGRLRDVHGISLTDYREMLALQGGRCAICGHSDLSDPNFFPLVDHCHKTGKIRGLLCMNCNQGLGKFKDSYNNLLGAAMYLQRNT